MNGKRPIALASRLRCGVAIDFCAASVTDKRAQGATNAAEQKSMNPRVISATLLYRTTLRAYVCDLLGNIKTPGRIQYSNILAVLNEARQPITYVCSEWSSSSGAVPLSTRFLGVFRQGARMNLGESPDWANSDLFVLRAMRIAREEIQAPLKDYQLTDLEAIALTAVLKELQSGRPDVANSLWSHIRDYDAAIVSFLTNDVQKRD